MSAKTVKKKFIKAASLLVQENKGVCRVTLRKHGAFGVLVQEFYPLDLKHSAQ